jgi:hypothetical protein
VGQVLNAALADGALGPREQSRAQVAMVIGALSAGASTNGRQVRRLGVETAHVIRRWAGPPSARWLARRSRRPRP